MKKEELLVVGRYLIPVKYSIERRSNVRAAIGRKAVHIRLPVFLESSEMVHQAGLMKNWVRQKLTEQPRLFVQFAKTTYTSGDTLRVGPYEYRIYIGNRQDDSSHSGRMEKLSIKLLINRSEPEQQQENAVRYLISKLVSNHQFMDVSQRILQLNEQFFNHHIKDIRIKHNQSNWGSCSSRRIINISSRLLFAPPDVRDYVYIHELAHLNHMNHSAAFWSVVVGIMPGYKEQEAWLKANSAMCNF